MHPQNHHRHLTTSIRGAAFGPHASIPRVAQILIGELVVLFMVAGIVFGGGYFKPSESNSGREWLIKADKTTSRQDAIEEAVALLYVGRNGTAKARYISSRLYSYYLVYRSKSKNVFTEENLKTISEIESILVSDSSYVDYCYMNYDAVGQPLGCSDKLSLAEVLYPNGTYRDDAHATLNALHNDPFNYGFFFSKDYDPATAEGEYTRSIVYVGLPLDGYTTKEDRTEEQADEIIENYLTKTGDQLNEYLGMKKKGLFGSKYMDRDGRVKGDIEILWWSFGLQQYEFAKAVMQDFMWSVFSVVSVGIYISIHTGSGFIAAIAMMEIAFTIFVSFFVYRLIFQITYFTSIHFLAAFLLLGIGADDVFVFVDAFKQSECQKDISGSLLKRLEYTSIRASKAVMITSLTTTVAFLATATSKVMPICTFGIYAALCIFLLYWINVVIMPPTLIVWDGLRRRGCCSRKAKGSDQPDQPNQPDRGQPAAPTKAAELRPIEKYFHGPHTAFVRKTRYGVLILFTMLTGLGVYYCTTLEPPIEQENYFPNDHMFTTYTSTVRSDDKSPFMVSGKDYVAGVQIVWGLRGMDLSGTDPWDPESTGKLVYDDAFDLSSAQAQQHVLDACERAKNAPCSAKGCANGMLVRNNQAKCFIEGFKAWLESDGKPWPAPQASFLSQLSAYAALDETQQMYRDQIGLFTDDEGNPELRFIAFDFNTTFSPPKPQSWTKGIYDNWEAFIAKENAMAPPGVDRAYQTTEFAWTWLKTQMELIKGVELGVTLVIVIAFVFINISTNNWVISLGAIFTIGGILTTTMGLGVVAIMDFPLGVAESVATVILIGFSMDYCLHLAGAYVASKKATRYERTRDSLTEMGVSVTAGALTTIFSAVFLFGTVLTFFQKFAFIIVFTIGASWVWSTCFFASFCMIFGPEGSAGEWTTILRIKTLKGNGKVGLAGVDEVEITTAAAAAAGAKGAEGTPESV